MSDRDAFKLASVLLQYPTRALFLAEGQLRAAATSIGPRQGRDAFGRFLDWLQVTPPTAVAQHYVETFDLRRRCALYLTYYRYGDTRNRGMAMLAFKTAFRAANFTPTENELPDYLPLVLEFASLSPQGATLLHQHRTDLELLRRALQDAETPYVHVIEAVATQLPGLKPRDLSLVKARWNDGPPHEDVGLEPFAPPEYMTGGQVRT